MDPITIGALVGASVVVPLTKELLKAAADPERVAKAVNWVFVAADNFLKIRRGDRPKESAIAQPPQPTVNDGEPAEVSSDQVTQKSEAADQIAKSLPEEAQVTVSGGIKMVALDNFAAEQLEKEILAILKQLDIYLDTLRHEENKAALHGGRDLAPAIVIHTIRIQEREIADRMVRLNTAMKQAYGVSAPDVELLSHVTA